MLTLTGNIFCRSAIRRLHLKFFVRIFLALQIAVGSNFAIAAGEKQPTDGLAKVGRTIEQLAEELEAAAGTQNLPPESSNAFYLNNQSAFIRGENFDLSRLNIELPSVAVSDFDKDIEIRADRVSKTLTFIKRDGEKVIASHTIRNIDIVSMARDKELLQMLDSKGQILAIDLAFSRSRMVLFKTPIPIFTVGELPDELKSRTEDLRVENVHRTKTAPFKSINKDAILPEDLAPLAGTDASDPSKIWTAGDLLITTQNDREVYGLYNRNVTLENIQMGFGILHSLAYAISPEGQSDAANTIYKDEDTAKKATVIADQIDPSTRFALAAFTAPVMNEAMIRLGFIKNSMKNQRDQFLIDEWIKDFTAAKIKAETADAEARKQAVAPQQNGVKAFFKKTFDRLVSKDGLKKIVILGTFAGGTVGLHEGLNYAAGANATAWAVYAAAVTYSLMPILQNSAYRVTMAKGILSLSGIVLIDRIIAGIVGKFRSKSFMNAFVTFGIRTAAFVQFNLFNRLANFARQKTLFVALRNGVGPFAKVRTNSTVGQIAGLDKDTRPGLINPLSNSLEFKNKIEQKKRVIAAAALVENRRLALASLLANLVIAEKFGLDPATLIMAESGELKTEEILKFKKGIQQIQTNTILIERHKKIALEIADAIGDIPEYASDIFKFENGRRFAELYAKAKATAEEMNSRSELKTLATNFKLQWRNITQHRLARAIGNWGYSQYQFLSQVEPTDFVSKQSWEQYSADFIFTVIQTPLFGPRAHLEHPEDLAHAEGQLLYSTPGNLASVVEQRLIYGVSAPARLAQIYGDTAIQVREEMYDPIEYSKYQSTENPEGVFRGLWGWMKGAGNLTEAQYGSIFMKQLKRQFNAIQLSIIVAVVTRLVVMGQPLSNAAPAYLFSLLMSTWMYGWPWVPITRGNQLYGESVDKLNARFDGAKLLLSRGLRFKDDGQLQTGMNEILKIYNENSNSDQKLQKLISSAEQLAQIVDSDRIQFNAIFDDPNNSKYLDLVANLKMAMTSKNETNAPREGVSSAYEELKMFLESNEHSNSMGKLSPEELLAYSVEHPPFKNKINEKVSLMLNVVGSIVTTLLGNYMFVDLQHNHDWGPKLGAGFLTSFAIYTTIFQAQKRIDNLSKTLDYIELRNAIPRAAIEAVEKDHPKFTSIEDYAKWLKELPSSPEAVRNVDINALVALMNEEADSRFRGRQRLLNEINAAQKPSLGEYKSCAALFKKEPTQPMSRAEKNRAIWSGLWDAPVK